ncbi:hypothetical protein F8388_004224 [Cannabis sativa]|uniref:Glycosyltransferase n=1 Tax=Cannabis sativa TaxID=3483 RepID=A0A7J6E791_CANSA|nr:hypothetical protein F8388_004224 [Cannabis sativa]
MKPHFLIVAFPARGHINPALQLAKRLIHDHNSQITFVTTLFAYRSMIIQDLSSLQQNDMSFVPFSDGYDNGLADVADFDYYRAELSRLGSLALAELIAQKSYKCLVYTLGLPWVADVAAEQNIPVALLWVQAAVVFDVVYYYFHGFKEIIQENIENSFFKLSFLNLPHINFTIEDLPTFLDSKNSKFFLVEFFRTQFGKIDEGSNPKILVNTFDELEKEALSSIVGKNLSLIGIGPLVSCNRSLSFDVNDVVLWLNSKKKTTVVYVCFGSIVVLSKAQMEEIGKGLLGFGFPFIWVIREKKVKNDNEIVENDNDEELSCREELEKLGMIVPWCSQIEVLSNESIGCFVTHCGWNSTLEGLVSGVPMVAFPQWVDQTTNAKLIENVWKVGARVKPNEEGIVEGGEIKRCLELVMGLGGKENGVENGEEIRRNSKKWKDLAKEAIMVGGSSHKNLKALISEVSGEVVDNAFSSKYISQDRWWSQTY